MGRKRGVKKNNIKIGIVFFVIVIFFIIFSFLGKTFFYVKEGKFDDKYPFALSIQRNSGFAVATFFPKQKYISLVNVDGKTILSPSQFLAIPIDGKIKSDGLKLDVKNPSTFFLSLLMHRVKFETDLTLLDIGRLMFFSKLVDVGSNKSQDIGVNDLDSVKDKAVLALFADPDIVSENLRIEIENGTGVYGLGNSVGRKVSNMGGNVIFVSTADVIGEESQIYFFDRKSYTVERLSRVLGLKAVKTSQKTIADVIIKIGKDKAEAFKF